MNWTDRYVGLKYQAGKFDCAELCRLVIREHLDVDIPLPSQYDWRKTPTGEVVTHLTPHFDEVIEVRRGGLIPTNWCVKPFDLVVMQNFGLGGSHVGLIADNRCTVLHCIKTHGTILTPWDKLSGLRLYPTMVCRWAYPYPHTQSAQMAQ